MSFLKSVAQFIIGKDPDIFDERGNVLHKFTDDKWNAWNNRLKTNPDYDWTNHVAREKIKQKPATSPAKK